MSIPTSAAARRRPSPNRRRVWLLVIILVIAGIAALLTPNLLQSLEHRFDAPTDIGAKHFDGVIALGGDLRRFDVAANLARQLPGVHVMFCARDNLAEVRDLLRRNNIPESDVTIELDSTTTYENALFAARILEPKPGQNWLLVTSAWHMPRAVGVFRRAGFDVSPWPVRQNDGKDSRSTMRLVWHEIGGLIGYRLLGRSSALYPAPATTE